MRIYVHDSSGGVLVSSVASRGTKKRRHKITGRSLVIDEAPGHAFHGNQWVEIAPGIHAPKSIANHPQFTKEKFLKYKEQGKTNAQISNILSAHKYHAEKKAGTHVPKKAAKASAPSEAAQTPPAAAEPAKEAPAPAAPIPEPKPEPPPPKLAPSKEELLKSVGFASPGVAAEPKDGKAMQKADADAIYAKSMEHGMEAITTLAKAAPASQANAVALTFKEMKAAQMAMWSANVNGKTVTPIPQQVFQADLELVKQLSQGTAHNEALAAWKNNTKKEKQGTWPPPSPEAIAAKAAIEAEKQAEAVKALAGKHKEQEEAAKAQAVLASATQAAQAKAMATAYALHPPAFPVITDYAPEGEGIHHDDFLSGKFKDEIESLKSKLNAGHPDSVTNKIGVQKALENKMLGSPAFQALVAQRKAGSNWASHSLEAQLVSAWAGSSGGANPISNAMQLAVRDAFGMKQEHISTQALSVFMHSGEEKTFKSAAENVGVKYETTEQKATVRAALRDFALGMHANTQDHFKQLGITHVMVARGMKNSGNFASSAEALHGNLKLQPASSFSANYGTASSFSGGHSVFMAKVPVSQVLSTYVTGYGCSSEHEVVVLAHPGLEAVRVSGTKAGNLSSAVSHVNGTLKMGESKSSAAVGELYAAKAAKATHAAKLKEANASTKPPKKPKGAKTWYATQGQAAAAEGDVEKIKELHAKYSANTLHGAAKPSGEYLQSLLDHFEQLPAKQAEAATAKAKIKADAKAAKQLPKDQPLSTAAYNEAMQAASEPSGPKAVSLPPHLQELAKKMEAATSLSPSHTVKEIDPFPEKKPEPAKPKATVQHIHVQANGSLIPTHIAEHSQFNAAKYQQWIAAGKSYAQISNNLSALKYHAEKKAGIWKAKKAA